MAAKFPRYSMKVLLLLMLIICAWIAVVTHRARRQLNGAKYLERFGAHFGYRHEMPALPYYHSVSPVGIRNRQDPLKTSPAPGWLRRLGGAHYFETIDYVSFAGCRIDDETLNILKCFPDIRFHSEGALATEESAKIVARQRGVNSNHFTPEAFLPASHFRLWLVDPQSQRLLQDDTENC